MGRENNEWDNGRVGRRIAIEVAYLGSEPGGRARRCDTAVRLVLYAKRRAETRGGLARARVVSPDVMRNAGRSM